MNAMEQLEALIQSLADAVTLAADNSTILSKTDYDHLYDILGRAMRRHEKAEAANKALAQRARVIDDIRERTKRAPVDKAISELRELADGAVNGTR